MTIVRRFPGRRAWGESNSCRTLEGLPEALAEGNRCQNKLAKLRLFGRSAHVSVAQLRQPVVCFASLRSADISQADEICFIGDDVGLGRCLVRAQRAHRIDACGSQRRTQRRDRDDKHQGRRQHEHRGIARARCRSAASAARPSRPTRPPGQRPHRPPPKQGLAQNQADHADLVAPSAIRTPISRVCWPTMCATMPYKPIAASTSASAGQPAEQRRVETLRPERCATTPPISRTSETGCCGSTDQMACCADRVSCVPASSADDHRKGSSRTANAV